MTILALDTSCDETAAAVVAGDSPSDPSSEALPRRQAGLAKAGRVLSSVVWDQLKLHRQWGGIVPHLARRAHEKRLPFVVEAALRRAKVRLPGKSPTSNKTYPSVSAVAVTVGPGLPPALEVGVRFAQKLALQHRLPLIPVNHLEGHIASVFLRRKTCTPYLPNLPGFPDLPDRWLNLIVSGGHTELVVTHKLRLRDKGQRPKVSSSLNEAEGLEDKQSENSFIPHPSSLILESRLLGATLDDAAGECLDKVGRELGLGYPAAPVIEKLAREYKKVGPSQRGRSNLNQKFNFPIPMSKYPKENLDFSFSGLKTAAVQQIYGQYKISKVSRRRTSTPITNYQLPITSAPALRAFCFTFQEAVINALLLKTYCAVELTGIKTFLLSGGVAANNRLRRRLSLQLKKLGVRVYLAPKKFCGDNAAMIGLAAHWALAREEALTTRKDILKLDRQPNLQFKRKIKPSVTPRFS